MIPSCAHLSAHSWTKLSPSWKAKGVSSLDAAYLEERMNFLAGKIEPGMKASMAHDLERGNRLELDWLSGKVRALGHIEHSDPASDTVYTVLKLHRMGSR